MIIVKLMGGLGNQMFQYAFGKCLAIKHDTILKLDLSFLNERHPNYTHTLRDYELNIFNIKEHFASIDDLQYVTKKTASFKDRLLSKITNKPIPFYRKSVIKQQGSDFDECFLLAPKNCLLIGYWQSEKYFKKIEEILRIDFAIKSDPDEQSKRILEMVTSSNSISIHFRRGDYILNEIINKYHGVCSFDYYFKAIEYILKTVDNPQFFVFSDDIEWVKSNFQINYPITYVDNNEGKSFEDLLLMSHCKHNIIANSSFSWWAAWLNPNPNKIVVAPEEWFNQSDLSTNDLIPDDWIRL